MLEYSEEYIDSVIEYWFDDYLHSEVKCIKERMKKLVKDQYEIGYEKGAEDQREMFK